MSEIVDYEEYNIDDDDVLLDGDPNRLYAVPSGINTDLDSLSTSTNAMGDNDLIVTKENGGTSWVKKSLSKLWDYIKGKTFSRTQNGLVPQAPSGSGIDSYLREDGIWKNPCSVTENIITTSMDLNNIITPGIYMIGGLAANRPTAITSFGRGILIVIRHASNNVMQFYISWTSNDTYIFMRGGAVESDVATWRSWNNIVSRIEGVKMVNKSVSADGTKTYKTLFKSLLDTLTTEDKNRIINNIPNTVLILGSQRVPMIYASSTPSYIFSMSRVNGTGNASVVIHEIRMSATDTSNYYYLWRASSNAVTDYTNTAPASGTTIGIVSY